MRPLRQDVTGTIDANGNATIPIKLPATGEWHELKIALSTSGPAEWAILVSGTAVTYGRGRRVTLGPELIQDGETVTVTVTGGPPSQAIIGAITGKSGTPEEMLASYGPQPNTIALDAVQPRQRLFPTGTAIPVNPAAPSFTIASGATQTFNFTLPAGTVAIRITPVPASGNSTIYSLRVVGNVTGEQYYGSPTVYGTRQLVPSPALPLTLPVEFDWDQSVGLDVHSLSGVTMSFFVSALFATEAPGQAGAPVPVDNADPASWQVPFSSTIINNNLAGGGGTAIIVGALAGIVVRVFDVRVGVDVAAAGGGILLQDTLGINYHVFNPSNTNPNPFVGRGIQFTAAAGVQVVNAGAGAVLVRGSVTYSQIPA